MVDGVLAGRLPPFSWGLPFPIGASGGRPFFEIFFVRPAPRRWYQEFEFSDSDSGDFSDPEDFDIV